MNYEDLTPEQLDKARSCKTVDDLMALVDAEGLELSDEQLDAVSGGVDWAELGESIAICTLLGH